MIQAAPVPEKMGIDSLIAGHESMTVKFFRMRLCLEGMKPAPQHGVPALGPRARQCGSLNKALLSAKLE